jgi:DNA end-binding protein Ku
MPDRIKSASVADLYSGRCKRCFFGAHHSSSPSRKPWLSTTFPFCVIGTQMQERPLASTNLMAWGMASNGVQSMWTLISLLYLRPDGKVGHDAFAVMRETIREMNKVAIGRVVLTNRERIIALEALDKGLMGTLLRYPYEVRSEAEYFDDIQDVQVTKDMLDLTKHIVNQKAGRFEPTKFEDRYEAALVELINSKRAGKPVTAKARPRGENVVDLMEALRRSVGGAAPAKAGKPAKKLRKAAAGQKEMLMPIEGKKPKEAAAKKPPARPQRKSA